MPGRKKIIALLLSLALHAGLVAAVVFYDVFRVYQSVEGLKIGDFGGQSTVRLISVANLPNTRKPQIAAARRVASLEELKRREKEKQAEDKQESKDAHQQVIQQTQPKIDPDSLKFGRLDTHPIKQHVAALWQAHERGRLDLPDTFRITAACSVNQDGSFSNIRIVESSGSAELDRAALAILAEISNQRAFAPLSRLSSVSAKLDIGPAAASFSLVGFAPNAALASDMAGQYQLMVSAARMFVPNSQARTLLNNTSVTSDLNRVSARLTLPRSLAARMMHEGFSGTE